MKQPKIRLAKGALSKINIGQSFAEYDLIRNKPDAFVKTPAINAALDSSHSKCFFVGRRGTGKTAITYYLVSTQKTAVQLFPQIFDIIRLPRNLSEFKDTRQRPFKTLVYCFQRALQDEVVAQWIKHNLFEFNNKKLILNRERNLIEDFDFDMRMMKLVDDTFDALNKLNEKEWLRQINRVREISKEMNELRESAAWDFKLLIDRIDESWNGSDEAVIMLMALMHACVQTIAMFPPVRPLLFLRENIFERVRQIDNEFARLETAVVSLDWSKEQLLELIERRLNLPFTSKLPLGGSTWDYFFESVSGQSSRSIVFDYCQDRPRDVLTYCGFSIDSAKAHMHEIVKIEDIQEARRRFSDSRLKDLGDEYAENYPQIQLVLNRFYGLGKEFTVSGIEAFIKKLLTDKEVQLYCATWIYKYTTRDLFIELLYNIGFIGIRDKESIIFRSLGPKSSTPPPINETTQIVIHPSYVDALNLRDSVIRTLDDATPLQKTGILTELPDETTLSGYQERLRQIQEDLKTLPVGKGNAGKYEEIVGEIIKLCFFRTLTNIQPKERDVDGCVIRDWIAANRANNGFWEMVRQRYHATQIVWECKNYVDLSATDFHQASYYMTKEIGHFVVITFRGEETKKQYYQHIKRVAKEKEGGIILLLNERDLNVFLRQAINGKVKEDHINDIYDRIVREIS